ncbi:MAG: hypothetical protein JWM64_2003 [Frankiales bacterium]|nr:hypothetical protein [Frankiales bacterium]
MTALDDAVAALHARLDAWAAAVETVGLTDEPDLDDPRLEAAEEEFDVAMAQFHTASLAVLGVDADDDEDADLEVEELALHVLVGLPEGTPEPVPAAAAIVHAAGERLVGQLTTAGYQVPAWQFGCEVELLIDDDEDA